MVPLHVWLCDGCVGVGFSLGSGAGAGWWGLSGGEGSDEGLPGGEDEIAGDGAQVLEEAPARAEGLADLSLEGFDVLATGRGKRRLGGSW